MKTKNKNKRKGKITLGCLPRVLSFMSSARRKFMKLTTIDEMRVIPSSHPHVPREDADSPYVLVWVARL